MARITGQDPRVCAFLDMLKVSELGEALIAKSDDGYNVLVGSTPSHLNLFTCYADHPRILVHLPNLGISSSAAGAYQIIAPTFDGLSMTSGIRSFSPISQDSMAVMLLKQCGAFPHILKGGLANPMETAAAIVKAAPIWASLPGAGYGQHENRMLDLLRIYGQKLALYENVGAGNA